ncbi:MAG: hypothetical protein ACXAAH_00555 [Promethearchaeota archaeon]|jgi:hypothetical protein
MLETYTDFMIFEVRNNGERSRLNITEEVFHQDNGKVILHSSQVAIIVKEGLRRIYLWKGISASVRKKFIASRVASEIQRELMNSSSFHRCKIVSVDQGDEPKEFLNTFDFQKIPINTEKNSPVTPKITNNENLSDNGSIIIEKSHVKHAENKNFPPIAKIPLSYENLKKTRKSEEILEKILRTNTHNSFTRKNIIVGTNILYGEVIKKADIFSNQLEEKGWEAITCFPKEIFEIEGAKLRIHVNKELGEIEAIEILEKSQSSEKRIENPKNIEYEKWTVKQLKQYCRENNLKVPSTYRKADIFRLVLEYNSSNQ